MGTVTVEPLGVAPFVDPFASNYGVTLPYSTDFAVTVDETRPERATHRGLIQLPNAFTFSTTVVDRNVHVVWTPSIDPSVDGTEILLSVMNPARDEGSRVVFEAFVPDTGNHAVALDPGPQTVFVARYRPGTNGTLSRYADVNVP